MPICFRERAIDNEDVHEIVSSTTATKRKRDDELQRSAPKKHKTQPVEEPTIVGRFFRLTNQLKVVEQDLKAERAATKTLRKKIEMLEAGKGSLDSLKVIEETICDREKTIAATQDCVMMLERSLERKELAMATAASVLKLSKPPV